MRIAAVVFDLDETLAVTDRDRSTLLDEATERAGVPDIERADYLEAHGTVEPTETREPIFAALLSEGRSGATGSPDAPDHDPAAVADAYREAVETALRPLDGVTDLVETLRRTYRVGLLTDGPRVAQEGKLARLGWEDLFDAVVVTGTLQAGKPDDGAFRSICSALDVDPGETVYVGDRPRTDVQGAVDAGLRAVQVCYEGGPDPHPAADATVLRSQLCERLPAVVRDL